MSAQPLQALFVEDSTDDVDLAVLQLQREGFDVNPLRVETERDLKTALAEWRPQVVLSDYSMPNFDGLRALHFVREFSPAVPFIFLSGTIGEDRAVQAIREGATDYIIKSNMRRLGTAVHRALRDAREADQKRVLEQARTELAAILEATPDLVAICSPDGRLRFLNAAACSVTGLEPADLDARSFYALHPAWAHDALRDDAMPLLERRGYWEGETAVLKPDGTEMPVSQMMIAHRGPDERLARISIIAHDITERKEYENRITYLANYDGLTDLPNRNLLRDRVTQLVQACRDDPGRCFALVVINIDRFRGVNDGLGQDSGDRLLSMIGERLRATAKRADTVARLGADVFAVLATELATAQDALTTVRNIQANFAAPYQLSGRDLYVTSTIGVAVYPRDGEYFNSLLRNAEAAANRAKSGGPSGYQFFTEQMTREAEEKLSLESDLQNAVTRREMQLHYQPQIALESGRIIGVEALLRWRHPERGNVSPAFFVPIAENTDLIQELGEFALTTACVELKNWRRHHDSLRMAVNVSARQFRNPTFVRRVDDILRRTGIEPACMELELTESILVEEPDKAAGILQTLKALGVSIALDDFGTGYSSLSYLTRFPLDCLKIDRSFVNRAMTDKHSAAVIESIISLSKALSLRVLAEGIETRQQLDLLRQLGCDEGQGYHFAAPMPAGELVDKLQATPATLAVSGA